ncbi:MAG: Imm44 family immunity protein [Chitinophagaceae bacterium]|nr:Imm44 family immunity protein [Chitinophagaceae bacterium]
MKIWIGGEVDSDISESFRIIRNKIESAINYIISDKHYGDGLVSWDIIIVIKKNDGKFSFKYNKRKKETDIRLPIKYDLFNNSTEKKRKEIVLISLLDCLEILKRSKMIDIDFDELNEDLKKITL